MGLNRTYNFVTILRAASDILILVPFKWLFMFQQSHHGSIGVCQSGNVLTKNVYASPWHIEVYHLEQSIVSSRCCGYISYVQTMHVRSKDKT